MGCQPRGCGDHSSWRPGAFFPRVPTLSLLSAVLRRALIPRPHDGNRPARRHRVCVTRSDILKEEVLFPQIKIPVEELMGPCVSSRPVCCGQGEVACQPDHPTITCTGGEQFPKEGWLSRQSGRIHPNKHTSKDKIVCRKG